MSYSEFQLSASDGLKLFGCEWTADKQAAGIICLVHGYGEHSGKYRHVAAALNEAGYTVLAIDLRGHGRSEGKRGHTPSYNQLMDDITLLLDRASQHYAGKPCFLYGHSMGGNLVLNFALRYKPGLKGIIASGPWLRLAFEPSKSKVFLGNIMNIIYPSFTQKNGMDTKGLSHESEPEKSVPHDPLLHGLISARLFMSVRQAGIWALEHAGEFSLPLLLMHGGDDPITSVEASRQFAAKIKGRCTLKIWEGLYHEIHNEPEQEKIFEYTISWLKTHETE